MRINRSLLVVAGWGVVTVTPASGQGLRSTPWAHPVVPGAPTGVTAFVDVGVVPMDTDRVLEHQTVLVERGRIRALGPVPQIQVPAGARTIAGRGDYLIPGMTDMHVHMFGQGFDGASLKVDSAGIENLMFIWLANGATTVRNMDWNFLGVLHLNGLGDPAEAVTLTAERTTLLMRMRARAVAGQVLGPRIYTAGPWMDPSKFQYYSGDSAVFGIAPEDVAARLAAYKRAGFDFVKPYFESGALFDSLAAAAKRLGLPLAGHVPPKVPVEHAIPLMKAIEHMTGYNQRDLHDTAVVRRLAEATHKVGTWNCVTLAVLEEAAARSLSANFAGPQTPYVNLIRAFRAAGDKLLVGTDVAPRRRAVSDELRALVGSGLTPYEALVAATRNPAEYFGTLQEIGTIAVGKRADLVLLPGNPLKDIRVTADLEGVMIGGRWVPRNTIDRRMTEINTGQ